MIFSYSIASERRFLLSISPFFKLFFFFFITSSSFICTASHLFNLLFARLDLVFLFFSYSSSMFSNFFLVFLLLFFLNNGTKRFARAHFNIAAYRNQFYRLNAGSLNVHLDIERHWLRMTEYGRINILLNHCIVQWTDKLKRVVLTYSINKTAGL